MGGVGKDHGNGGLWIGCPWAMTPHWTSNRLNLFTPTFARLLFPSKLDSTCFSQLAMGCTSTNPLCILNYSKRSNSWKYTCFSHKGKLHPEHQIPDLLHHIPYGIWLKVQLWLRIGFIIHQWRHSLQGWLRSAYLTQIKLEGPTTTDLSSPWDRYHEKSYRILKSYKVREKSLFKYLLSVRMYSSTFLYLAIQNLDHFPTSWCKCKKNPSQLGSCTTLILRIKNSPGLVLQRNLTWG